MNTRIYQKGFSGGEISPEMFGRIDDVKYQNGAARINNWVLRPQGVLVKRPGFEFRANTSRGAGDPRTTKSRLIPFQFSVDQALVIELRAWDGVNQTARFGTMRFHLPSGLLQHATPTTYIPGTTVTFSGVSSQLRVSSASWTGTPPATPPFAQDEAVCFRNTGGALPPQLSPNTLYYVDYDIPTAGTGFFLKASPTGSRIAFTTAGTGTHTVDKFYDVGSVVTYSGANYLATVPIYSSAGLGLITSTSLDALWFQQFSTALELKHSYLESEIFDLTYTQSFDVVSFAHPNHPVRELSRFGATAWSLTASVFNTTPQVTGVTATPTYGMAWRWDWANSDAPVSGMDRHWINVVGPSQHKFSKGDLVYCRCDHFPLLHDKFFVVASEPSQTSQMVNTNTILNGSNGGNAFGGLWSEDVAYLQRLEDEGYVYQRITATKTTGTNTYPFQLNTLEYESASWWRNGTGVRICDSNSSAAIPLGAIAYLDLDPSFATTKRFRLFLDDGSQLTGGLVAPIFVAFAVLVNGRSVSTTSEAFGHYEPRETEYALGRCGLLQFVTSVQDALATYRVTAEIDDAEGPASASVTATNNLLAIGSKNTLTWSAVPGATRYNVYKEVSGLFGFIGNSETTSFVDDNITPDFSKTPPYVESVFNAAGLYPGAVAYFDQRKCFAGALDEPNKLYMSKPFTETEFSYRLPSNDSDRIEVEVAAREANRIRHIVPLGELLLLTNASEWRVSPINSEALTPSTISVRPQSYNGANAVQPIIVNNSAIFCAARGGHVRELGFNFQSQGFVTGDLSLRAPHLFDDYSIVDAAYQKSPVPVLWFVSTSGKLLGLTYVPEEQVGGWHQHDVGGVVESVAVIPDGQQDRLWAVVRRTVGAATIRTVERMAPLNQDVAPESIYCDGALLQQKLGTYAKGSPESLVIAYANHGYVSPTTVVVQVGSPAGPILIGIATYNNANSFTLSPVGTWGAAYTQLPAAGNVYIGFSTITQLEHLEGLTVDVVADGILLENLTVENGQISLDGTVRPIAATAVVGIKYTSEIVTVPAAMQIDGMGQGRAKNINKAWLKVSSASKVSIGPTGSLLVPGNPPASAQSTDMQEIDVTLLGSWRNSGQVTIRHRTPYPMTILGMTYEVAIGG